MCQQKLKVTLVKLIQVCEKNSDRPSLTMDWNNHSNEITQKDLATEINKINPFLRH